MIFVHLESNPVEPSVPNLKNERNLAVSTYAEVCIMNKKQGMKQGTFSLVLIAAIAVVVSMVASSKIIDEQKVIARRAALSIKANHNKPSEKKKEEDRSRLFSIRKAR